MHPLMKARPRRRVLTGLLAAWPMAAIGGLSLDEALVRHRQALAPDDAPPFPVTDGLAASRPDGFAIAFAREIAPGPALLGMDGLREGGARVLASGPEISGLHWRVGATVRERGTHRADLDGSIVSAPLGAGRLYLSSERHHWGPGWTASLILDGAAPPVPALGWRKTAPVAFETRWLAWLGPWNADVFAGQLSAALPPERVKLIGMRFQFAPLRGLELGLSRTLQWGGQGRPENARSLLNALLGIDNVDGADRSEEPGNQLGGFDARYTLRLPRRIAFGVYGQAIGEDEAGGLPSVYLRSAGADVAGGGGGRSWRVFVEHADTRAGGTPGAAYRNALYPAGYAQHGAPLGHPAGGDIRLSTFGALAEHGPLAATLRLHRGRAFGPPPSAPPGPLRGVDLAAAWQLPRGFSAGGTLSRWRDALARRTQAQVWWRLDWP